MNKKFLSTILHYVGIGFISGAIFHGFFSGQRSVIMTVLGILIFLLAEMMSEEKKHWYEIIVFVIIFSIAIGMVSGGLQHFLDSPMRSLWIVPVGYIVALAVYQLQHAELPGNKTKTLLYGILTSGVLFGVMYGALQVLPASWFMENHHGSKNEAHSDSHDTRSPKEDHSEMGHKDHGDMIIDELSFIQLMIPHHQEAVDSTTELLKTTTDVTLQELGKNIIEGQEQEIAMMRTRLSDWYSGTTMDYGSQYMLMMRPTTGISESNQRDQWRTTDMIVHHEGAVQMAEKILTLPNIRPEIQDFAQKIVRVQGEEIVTMRTRLDDNVVIEKGIDMNDHGH